MGGCGRTRGHNPGGMEGHGIWGGHEKIWWAIRLGEGGMEVQSEMWGARKRCGDKEGHGGSDGNPPRGVGLPSSSFSQSHTGPHMSKGKRGVGVGGRGV